MDEKEDWVIEDYDGKEKTSSGLNSRQCPECGAVVGQDDVTCKNCGFPLKNAVNRQPVVNRQETKKHSALHEIGVAVAVIFVIWMLATALADDEDNSNKLSEQGNTETYSEEESGESAESGTQKTAKNNKKEKSKKKKSKKKKSNSKLTKAQYMKKCKKLYYNNVFFGKKNLNGKLVKLDVFVKQTGYLDPYSLSDYEFKEKWKLKRTMYFCSVKRKNKNSYAGMGEVDVLFSNKKAYKVSTSRIGNGSKFTVYGEVVSWSNNTYDGYNNVQVVARFIEGV